MIGVDRGRVPAPPFLERPEVQRARESASSFFRLRSRSARQQRHNFNLELLADPELIDALGYLFSYRCAFCTRDADTAGSLVVHHFRPPQGAVDSSGETSRRHYWWLGYTWENLYLACEECHTAKGAKFPVGSQRARSGTSQEGLAKEEPLLLDPCADNPERELVYLDSGEVVPTSRRGQATIETLELNRPSLCEARREEKIQIDAEITVLSAALRSRNSASTLANLRALFDKTLPLAAQRRQYANQWVQVRPRKVEAAIRRASDGRLSLEDFTGRLTRITNAIKDDVAAYFFGASDQLEEGTMWLPPAAAPVEPIYQDVPAEAGDWSYLSAAEIWRVQIRNFRAIRDLELRLATDAGAGSWLMLLGENGTGKTSVLQAIALALSSEETVTRLPVDTDRLLSEGTEEGFVRLTLTGSRRHREIRFARGIKGFESHGQAEGVLVAGYGPTRLLAESVGAEQASSKIAALFDPRVSLVQPRTWIPTLDLEEFSAVARALKHLLDLDEREELRIGNYGLTLVRGKSQIPLSDLSDGYKAMAAFGMDMMQFFLQRWGSLEAAEGIVLVDELGAHLHPRWQMKVTRSLREAFPRVQFVATTHDPLCLRGLRDGEVAVLRRRDHRTYALQDDLPPVDGLAVDQLLTSEHFGLNSTLDPAMEDRLERYYALLAERQRSDEDEQELRELAQMLEQRRLLGSTFREHLALTATDEFIAQERHATSAETYLALKQRTKDRISSIWQESLPR